MVIQANVPRRTMNIRVGKYSVDETLARLSIVSFKDYTSELRYLNVDGYKVKRHSKRYQLFRQSTACCNCKIKGEFFALETTDQIIHRANCNNHPILYHFNLYAIKDGKEILMTKDHILPISRGGTDNINNLQVMCQDCNVSKNSTLPPDFHVKECCHFMKIHSLVVNQTIQHFTPFIFCPWCRTKIKYIKNPSIIKDIKDLKYLTINNNVVD